MNEQAALLVIMYIEKHLERPFSSFPREQFENRSYSRWAADEILQLIMDHPHTPPEDLISQFIIKMHCFYAASDYSKMRKMFSIAEDTADDIYNKLFAS